MNISFASNREQIAACYPVICHLRPHLDRDAFWAAVERMRAQGYQLIFISDPDIRAVAGFRMMEMLATGPVLYVDDLVTAPQHRSRGYGTRLLQWLLNEAKNQKCQYLELDSGLKRLDAHRFYERNGLEKAAYHFDPALANARWTVAIS